MNLPKHMRYMKRCFDLAQLGRGNTRTNPKVGAVLVHQNGRIISEGYHHFFGGPHAEADALSKVSAIDLSSSTIYVSLEPCAHTGKTPPCCELIHERGIGSVVVSVNDPNPLVNSKGISYLREHGLNVQEHVLEEAGRHLIRPFLKRIETNRPYIILKWAQSLDGFMGSSSERIKISNPMTDRLVHKWRAETDAILIGRKTAIVDDPELTTRLYPGKNPLRVLIDPGSKVPSDAKIFAANGEVLVCSIHKHPSAQHDHVNQLLLNGDSAHFLPQILNYLTRLEVGCLFVEGGSATLARFLSSGLWDECRVITASRPMNQGISAPIPPGKPVEEHYMLKDRISVFHHSNGC